MTHLVTDLESVSTRSAFPFVLLGIALLIVLGFEFVNGFHDTANAGATVICTQSLSPHLAVVWSGAWNTVRSLLLAWVLTLPASIVLAGGLHWLFRAVF